MSWEWPCLIGITVVGIFFIIFRNTPFVKSNWKYALILAPFAALLILRIISGSKGKVISSGSQSGDKDLEKEMGKLKERLEEVQMETAIEVSAAKTKNEEIVKQLEEVKKIEDKTERRKRLASMVG
jgi:hypothetical protein